MNVTLGSSVDGKKESMKDSKKDSKDQIKKMRRIAEK